MANGATKCAHAVGGNSQPMQCMLTNKPCICQRWCIHEHYFKHTDVSHCKDYTPKVKK